MLNVECLLFNFGRNKKASSAVYERKLGEHATRREIMPQNVVQEKSYAFALSIVKLYSALCKEQKYVIARQLLRSGTSIGANIEEAQAGQSRRDFLAKMSIASKEARETNYWLRLLRDSGTIVDLADALTASEELIRLLTSIVKTTSK
jgi:four helix bundle protein